jgi:hypothetical protein
MRAMILPYQIIEVLALPQFAVFRKRPFHFPFSKRFWLGSMFVHGDHPRLTHMGGSERFEKEALGGLRISRRTNDER